MGLNSLLLMSLNDTSSDETLALLNFNDSDRNTDKDLHGQL